MSIFTDHLCTFVWLAVVLLGIFGLFAGWIEVQSYFKVERKKIKDDEVENTDVI